VRGFALAAALAAAAFLPGERMGVAVPLVAALMLAAAGDGLRASPLRLALGALACALAVQAALLDADWVVGLDLTAAWALASLAAAGPALASIAAPFRALRLVPAVTPRPSGRWAPVARGSMLSTLLVVPFALLFLSADAAFAGFAGELPLPSGASVPGRVATLAVVFAAALGLGLATRVQAGDRKLPSLRKLPPFEWALPLVLLDLLFAAFVVVQLAVLFGGRDHVLRTTGLTYAEYARSGFWQLLVVTGLTFAVAGAVWKLADVPRPRDGVLLRLLLGALLCLTLVVLASAVHRLALYEDAFGLTRLRLLAETIAFWLGALLLLAGAAGASTAVRARTAPIAVVMTALGLLGFSLGNPDGRIAERNIDRWRATGLIDEHYLASLSADAVPALARLPLPQRRRATRLLVHDLRTADPWSSANVSRHRARKLLGLPGS
jgi:hypothetical protein